jgi:hypothetical protein
VTTPRGPSVRLRVAFGIAAYAVPVAWIAAIWLWMSSKQMGEHRWTLPVMALAVVVVHVIHLILLLRVGRQVQAADRDEA